MTNFFIYGGFATFAPLFVLYYQELGFSGTQIGLITGVTPLITIVSAPFWTNLADRTRRYHLIWGSLFALVIVTLVLFPYFKTFPIVFFLLVLINLVVGPFVSFTDTATMHMLGDEKAYYGRVRLGGTFGFGISAAVAGVLVEKYGLSSAFQASALLLTIAFLFSRKLAFGEPVRETSGEAPVRVVDLLRNPRWQVLLFITFTSAIGFVAAGTYFYPYMAGLGAREAFIGWALFVGTMAEIPVLFFGDRLFRVFRPFTLLVTAALVTGLRLLMFGLNTSPEIAMAIQLLNGLTFILLWMAGVAYADKHAPPNMKATVQGLFASMNFGIGSAVGGFLAGPLLVSIGGNGLFTVFGAIVTVSALIGLGFGQRLRRQSASSLA